MRRTAGASKLPDETLCLNRLAGNDKNVLVHREIADTLLKRYCFSILRRFREMGPPSTPNKRQPRGVSEGSSLCMGGAREEGRGWSFRSLFASALPRQRK